MDGGDSFAGIARRGLSRWSRWSVAGAMIPKDEASRARVTAGTLLLSDSLLSIYSPNKQNIENLHVCGKPRFQLSDLDFKDINCLFSLGLQYLPELLSHRSHDLGGLMIWVCHHLGKIQECRILPWVGDPAVSMGEYLRDICIIQALVVATFAPVPNAIMEE